MDANLVGAFVAAIALGLGIGLTWAEHVTREQRKIDGDGLLDVADAMGVTKCTCFVRVGLADPEYVHAPSCPGRAS